MNIAPKISPPPNTWYAVINKLPSYIKDITATVPMYDTGIFQEITPLYNKYAPPIINKIAEVSPIHPGTLPKITSVSGCKLPSAPFTICKGVAADTASTPAGFSHPNILVGQDATNIALPAKAGLIKLFPIPPNTCFTTAIANIEPINGIHQGAEGGRLNANNIPVTTALRSLIVTSFFSNFLIIASVATAEITAILVNLIESKPK